MNRNHHSGTSLQRESSRTQGTQWADQLRFVYASTPREKREIFNTRARNYRGEHSYLLTELGGWDSFDDHSKLYCLMVGDRAVATCRLTAFGEAGWEASGVVPSSMLQFEPERTVQISRVLVDREFRGKGLHLILFHHLCVAVQRETSYTHYFALCQERLMRLYRRVGALPLESPNILIPSRCARPYGLIFGEIAVTKEHLSALLPRLAAGTR